MCIVTALLDGEKAAGTAGSRAHFDRLHFKHLHFNRLRALITHTAAANALGGGAGSKAKRRQREQRVVRDTCVAAKVISVIV